MIATWTGAVSNDWNNDDDCAPAVACGSGKTILILAPPAQIFNPTGAA
jgi:hypothetical protein